MLFCIIEKISQSISLSVVNLSRYNIFAHIWYGIFNRKFCDQISLEFRAILTSVSKIPPYSPNLASTGARSEEYGGLLSVSPPEELYERRTFCRRGGNPRTCDSGSAIDS
jgi:hypothetical protein